MSQELTVDDQILTWLHYWNITAPVEIEDKMKDAILTLLSSEHTINVYLDDEQGLVIEGDE